MYMILKAAPSYAGFFCSVSASAETTLWCVKHYFSDPEIIRASYVEGSFFIKQLEGNLMIKQLCATRDLQVSLLKNVLEQIENVPDCSMFKKEHLKNQADAFFMRTVLNSCTSLGRSLGCYELFTGFSGEANIDDINGKLDENEIIYLKRFVEGIKNEPNTWIFRDGNDLVIHTGSKYLNVNLDIIKTNLNIRYGEDALLIKDRTIKNTISAEILDKPKVIKTAIGAGIVIGAATIIIKKICF